MSAEKEESEGVVMGLIVPSESVHCRLISLYVNERVDFMF
jgi:hypothetical protein